MADESDERVKLSNVMFEEVETPLKIHIETVGTSSGSKWGVKIYKQNVQGPLLSSEDELPVESMRERGCSSIIIDKAGRLFEFLNKDTIPHRDYNESMEKLSFHDAEMLMHRVQTLQYGRDSLGEQSSEVADRIASRIIEE